MGLLAGAFWLTAAAASLPITLSIGTSPSRALVAALPAALIGVVCLVVPWASISERWLHGPSLAGSIAVAVVVANAGPDGAVLAWLAVPVVLYAALTFSRRGGVFGELCFSFFALGVAALAIGEPGILLSAAPALIAITIVVLMQRERLKLHSGRDPLTGVGNYRVLRERLRYEVIRHERHRRSFAVLLLDLDRFKLVNDRYGHLEGDRLLRSVARCLTKSVRDQDTVARQGGDEFSALLPETGDRGAAIVAGKIDAALAEIVFGGVPVRASTGWAVFPQDGRAPEALLAAADERQREAKQSRHRDVRVADAAERVAA